MGHCVPKGVPDFTGLESKMGGIHRSCLEKVTFGSCLKRNKHCQVWGVGKGHPGQGDSVNKAQNQEVPWPGTIVMRW